MRMPVSRITTNFILGEDKQKLVDGFHQIMCDTLKIKDYDRLTVIDEKPDDFFQPLNTEGKYVFIEIQFFAGRSIETKRKLYQRIVKLLIVYDIPVDNNRIVLHEIAKENWGIRGGQAACDVDLGYSVQV
ncbi:tautomerase family protein [candidate division KSB1 bacterium]|nr:tautomerase family protein [candidate division KSB1 bacterium]